MYKPLKYLGSVSVFLFLSTSPANAWDGETHKRLTLRAEEILEEAHAPSDEINFYRQHREALLRGSVNADRYAVLHHVYFETKNGRKKVTDNSAAFFAYERIERAVNLIQDARKRGNITEEEKDSFAELVAQAAHCEEDMFSVHTTPYEDRALHRKIEEQVGRYLEQQDTTDLKIKFDGKLRHVVPYDEIIRTAREAHYGKGKILPAEEIERRLTNNAVDGLYQRFEDWDSEVRRSFERTIEVQVNRTAEILHTAYQDAFVAPIIDITSEVAETANLAIDAQKEPNQNTQILQTQQPETNSSAARDFNSGILQSKQETKEQDR